MKVKALIGCAALLCLAGCAADVATDTPVSSTSASPGQAISYLVSSMCPTLPSNALPDLIAINTADQNRNNPSLIRSNVATFVDEMQQTCNLNLTSTQRTDLENQLTQLISHPS